MDYDEITNLSLGGVALLSVGLPAWLVFLPPRMMRPWPAIIRPLLAIPITYLTLLALLYGWTYPAVRTFSKAHPGLLLDGILLQFPPEQTWTIPAVIAPILFAIRYTALEIRGSSLPDPH